MHTQHLKQKLDRIERASGLDGDNIPPLTFATVLTDDLTI